MSDSNRRRVVYTAVHCPAKRRMLSCIAVHTVFVNAWTVASRVFFVRRSFMRFPYKEAPVKHIARSRKTLAFRAYSLSLVFKGYTGLETW